MLQIALIGAGQLGSRHLQGLALLSQPARVTVVDPFAASLATAQERFVQVEQQNVEAVFAQSFNELPQALDGAVVATNADRRREAIERLLARSRVRVALLEKVLFQRIEDYGAIGTLLDKSGTRAWVNCSQRLWPFFRDLRPKTLGKSNVRITVRGANWGLGCNAIHNLDLLSFLTGDGRMRLETALDTGTIPSKRQDFIEFTGTLSAFGERGNSVIQTSDREGDAPFAFEVQTEDFHSIWNVLEGTARVSDAASGWNWREEKVSALYQSNLTHLVLAEMLDHGRSVLPGYAESAALHLSMLGAFLRHLGPGAELCAIT
jgi:hypothetical protein